MPQARLLLTLILILTWTLPAMADEPAMIYVDNVRFKGFPAKMAGQIANWGPTLAEEVRASLERSKRLNPMTMETLQAQLGKEKIKKTLACKQDQACINKIIENFGCSESIFTTVWYLSPTKAQVTMIHARQGTKVAGGNPAYARPDYDSLAKAVRSMGSQLIGMSPPPEEPPEVPEPPEPPEEGKDLTPGQKTFVDAGLPLKEYADFKNSNITIAGWKDYRDMRTSAGHFAYCWLYPGLCLHSSASPAMPEIRTRAWFWNALPAVVLGNLALVDGNVFSSFFDTGALWGTTWLTLWTTSFIDGLVTRAKVNRRHLACARERHPKGGPGKAICSAYRPKPKIHDGWMVRINMGPSYSISRSSADDDEYSDKSRTLTSFAANLDLAVGYAIKRNHFFSLNFYSHILHNDFVDEPDDIGTLAFGFGYTAYMKKKGFLRNTYLSGAFAVSFLENNIDLQDPDGDSWDSYNHRKKQGFLLELLWGKEWRMGDRWSLGTALQLLYERTSGDIGYEWDSTWTSWNFGLLMSATYD